MVMLVVGGTSCVGSTGLLSTGVLMIFLACKYFSRICSSNGLTRLIIGDEISSKASKIRNAAWLV